MVNGEMGLDQERYREARERHYLIEQKVEAFRGVMEELLDFLYDSGRFNIVTKAMTEEDIYSLRDNVESVTRAVGLRQMSLLSGKEHREVIDIEVTLKKVEMDMVRMSKGLNALEDAKALELEGKLREAFMDWYKDLYIELKETG